MVMEGNGIVFSPEATPEIEGIVLARGPLEK
jgi:hypothetical protein